MTECLDRPAGRWLVRALRSAKKWGRRPTEFLGVPGDTWGEMDSTLAGALDMYEDTRVGSYGYPKRLTEGDYEGYFEVEERQDNAQMAIDLWRKKHKNGPAPGMVPTVVFTGTED